MREQLLEVINVTWAGHNLFFALTSKLELKTTYNPGKITVAFPKTSNFKEIIYSPKLKVILRPIDY